MTKVSDVIEKGEAIPDDVTEVDDANGYVWSHRPTGWWGPRAQSLPGEMLVSKFGPLTVTAVREPDPTPSGLCEVGADRVTCIVAAPEHRRIYHGGSTLGDVATTLLAQQPERDVEDDVHYYISELRPGSTFCGIGLEEDNDLSTTDVPGKATCDTCRAEADEDAIASDPRHVFHPDRNMYCNFRDGSEICGRPAGSIYHLDNDATPPEPAAPSVLLDLVRQYGDDRAEAARRVATGGLALDALSRAETLLDRIAALVPQQPSAPDFLAAVNKLTIERDEARADLDESRGQARAMAATAERFHAAILRSEEQQERADHDLMSALAVDRLDEVLPAIERLRTAQPHPSVLSLPTVPDGTIAIVGTESRRRWEFKGGRTPWFLREEALFTDLAGVLVREGSVTVVMREPRTVAALTPDMDLDMALLRGVSGRVWRREAVGPGWVTKGEHRCNIGDLFFTDGPLTEVFADEPGGEPR